MAKYSKFIIALLTACGVAATALTDWSLSTSEIVSIVMSFLGALGVYQVKNNSEQ